MDELPDDGPGGTGEVGISLPVAPPPGPAVPPVPAEPLLPDDVPLLPDCDGMPVALPSGLPLPLPEPPPLMPAQALSSSAQAIGNIDLVIEHSR